MHGTDWQLDWKPLEAENVSVFAQRCQQQVAECAERLDRCSHVTPEYGPMSDSGEHWRYAVQYLPAVRRLEVNMKFASVFAARSGGALSLVGFALLALFQTGAVAAQTAAPACTANTQVNTENGPMCGVVKDGGHLLSWGSLCGPAGWCSALAATGACRRVDDGIPGHPARSELPPSHHIQLVRIPPRRRARTV